MQRKLEWVFLLLGMAAGAAQAQSFAPGPAGSTESVTIVQPAGGPAMHKLATSAQRLRDAIQLMSEKPAGPERDTAIARAQSALRATEQAMADLPPAPQATGPVRNTAGYDTSVRALMAAADALRDSIHAMAARPAGAGRNQAIREANRALLRTQVAMADAYDATTYPEGANVLGAGQAVPPGTRTVTVVRGTDCVKLGTMWGCRP